MLLDTWEWFWKTAGTAAASLSLCAAFLIVVAAGWLWSRTRRKRLAPDKLIAEVEQLLNIGEYAAAEARCTADASLLGKMLAEALGRLHLGHEESLRGLEERWQFAEMKFLNVCCGIACITFFAPVVCAVVVLAGLIVSAASVSGMHPGLPPPPQLGIIIVSLWGIMSLVLSGMAASLALLLWRRIAQRELELRRISQGLLRRFARLRPPS